MSKWSLPIWPGFQLGCAYPGLQVEKQGSLMTTATDTGDDILNSFGCVTTTSALSSTTNKKLKSQWLSSNVILMLRKKSKRHCQTEQISTPKRVKSMWWNVQKGSVNNSTITAQLRFVTRWSVLKSQISAPREGKMACSAPFAQI
jgi:hypothetical protein